jgi:hypothetical protein
MEGDGVCHRADEDQQGQQDEGPHAAAGDQVRLGPVLAWRRPGALPGIARRVRPFAAVQSLNSRRSRRGPGQPPIGQLSGQAVPAGEVMRSWMDSIRWTISSS